MRSLILALAAVSAMAQQTITLQPGQSVTITAQPAPTPPTTALDYSALCAAAPTGLPPLPAGVVVPALPQACPHIIYPTPSSTVTVATAAALQSAINSAAKTCGVRIAVLAGAQMSGNWTLPAANCTAKPILIEGSGIAGLPAWQYPPESVAGTSAVPTLIGAAQSTPPITVADGANGYYLSGIEITLAPGVANVYCMVCAGEATTSVGALPQSLVLDRVLIHPAPCVADSMTNHCLYVARGVDLNSPNGALLYSTVYGFVDAGQDSQAVALMNTSGPALIAGNYLEATGENCILNTECTVTVNSTTGVTGFATGDIGMTNCPPPSDVTVRLNHIHKLLAWQALPAGCSQSAYTCYTVKNLFEIKHGQRVLLDSNWLDTTFQAAQSEAIISNCFYPGLYVCQDFTVTNNLVEHVPELAAVAGNSTPLNCTTCGLTGTQPITTGVRVMFRNNIATDVNGVTYGGPLCVAATGANCAAGLSWQVQNTNGFIADHNTIINRPGLYTNGLNFSDGAPSTDLNFRDTYNIQFGQPFANGALPGGAIAGLPSPVFEATIFVGDWWQKPNMWGAAYTPAYPSGIYSLVSTATEAAAVGVAGNTATPGQLSCGLNNYPLAYCWQLDWALVGFTDFPNGSTGANPAGLTLAPASPYRALDSGADVGANIAAVLAATGGIK